ncbi:PQQ-dependent catabolism-associated CXXCW motif protein [Rhodospirillaceae bacterium SYSU D60014]|uniref:PQQ-dependent catabolism-associated CXXCW motif protein n=1 Tax=Virgifigura deserti TaxID=2268457 RepID=UPI000E673787
MLDHQAARRVRSGVAAALLLVAAPAFADGTAAQAVPEPEGYRLDLYRAPTPDTIAGGTVVSTEKLQALLADDGVILIDVLPEQRKPDNLPASTLWFPKPRNNIPGSVWLPDVGRGELSQALESYFRSNLERLAGGDKERKLVFYCLSDCWMSWNAAKRAIDYGYASVYWYPEGTDGWAAAGLPLEESRPVPLPDAATPPA